MTKYDTAVIGGGLAGLIAALRSSKRWKKSRATREIRANGRQGDDE